MKLKRGAAFKRTVIIVLKTDKCGFIGRRKSIPLNTILYEYLSFTDNIFYGMIKINYLFKK